MIDIRAATRDDYEAFYGKPPGRTVRALAAFNGAATPTAIGGYYLDDGAAVVFTDGGETLSKRDRVRGARAVMALVAGLKMPVVALDGADGEVALRHFGFEKTGNIWRLP